MSTYLEICNGNAYRQRHISDLGSVIGISNRHSTGTHVCITNSLHLCHIQKQINDNNITGNSATADGLRDALSISWNLVNCCTTVGTSCTTDGVIQSTCTRRHIDMSTRTKCTHRRRKGSVVGEGDHGECEARAYNGGLGAEPPAGSRGTAPGQGVRGRSPLKLKAFWSLDVQRSRQI